MDDMPRPRPPHLHRQVTRRGEVVWYVRIGHGPRTRIRASFGTREFEAEYQAALSNQPPRPKSPTNKGTLKWLVERHRETTAWMGLSLATRRQRENIFRQVLEAAGAQPLFRITTSSIMAGRDRRAATPSQARHFLDAMRGLFRWAAKARIVRMIRQSELMIRRVPRVMAFRHGLRITSLPTSGDGRWGRGKEFGLPCFSRPDSGAVMPVRIGRQHVRDVPAYFLLLITRQSGRSCFLAHRGNVERISIRPRCQTHGLLAHQLRQLGDVRRDPPRPSVIRPGVSCCSACKPCHSGSWQ